MKTAAMILLVLTLAAGCKASEGAACAKPEDCGSGLTCSPRNLCETPRSIACKTSLGCENVGECIAKDGVCIAASDDDCQKSTRCKVEGECTAKDGRCTHGAATDADCAKIRIRGTNGYYLCQRYGKCTASSHKDGVCIATSDTDCEKSDICTAFGKCTAKDGVCER